MLYKINSCASIGIEMVNISVEINIFSRGLPCFNIIGLANKSVEESKHRVYTAIQNSGNTFPNKKITVNLAPADIPKHGSFYDLPIAIGILCHILNIMPPDSALFYGELSLDGSLRNTKGVLLACLYAKNNNFRKLYFPEASLTEATSAGYSGIMPVKNLSQLVMHLDHGERILTKPTLNNTSVDARSDEDSITNIKGHILAKRVLTISAAGGHHVMFVGSPGVGKTVLARSLNSILPPLNQKEYMEVAKIYSSVGLLTGNSARPFRSPHHTISHAGMLGGGTPTVPGEISFAHRGVLFMDEFPEFSRSVLEALRQPLEDGEICIVRNKGMYRFPSKFSLVAACNPCPCGYYGDEEHKCICSPRQINNYRIKFSGPILDRIDLYLQLTTYNSYFFNTSTSMPEESLATIRNVVTRSRSIQCERFKNEKILNNSELTGALIDKYVVLSSDADVLLKKVVVKLNLSIRAFLSLKKVARTIADLNGSEVVQEGHIAESIQYRYHF